MLQHQRGLPRRRFDQADHVGERVEQEMRLDLGLQQFHPRLDQLLFGGQRAHLLARHVFSDLALFPLTAQQADPGPGHDAVHRQADAPADQHAARPGAMRRSKQMEGDHQSIDHHVDHGVHIEEAQRTDAAAGIFIGALLGGGSPDAGVGGVHGRSGWAETWQGYHRPPGTHIALAGTVRMTVRVAHEWRQLHGLCPCLHDGRSGASSGRRSAQPIGSGRRLRAPAGTASPTGCGAKQNGLRVSRSPFFYLVPAAGLEPAT
ncbi:hypothetical protein D9M70_511960 [compost metagenome]